MLTSTPAYKNNESVVGEPETGWLGNRPLSFRVIGGMSENVNAVLPLNADF